jgi:tetratricopeptide (TPR) repeat protein
VIDLGERALALDPQNEPAMVDLSLALNDRVANLWSDDAARDTVRAEKLANSALALQPDDTRAHMAMAQVFFAKQQWKAAISQAEAALADNPNNPDAHANFSFWNMFLGHSEDGFAGVETAIRLSPRDPNVSGWQFFMCHLHTHLAQWEQAIEWCGKSIASGNASMYPYVDLAAANAWAGHDKEAKDAVAQLRKLYPDFTVQTWAGIHGATIRPSTNNTRASSRAYARRGCRRARRRRIEPARPRPCASAEAAEGPFRARAVELAKREGRFRALKAASRSQWDGGFGTHSGPSGGDRRKRAFRPKRKFRRGRQSPAHDAMR